MDLVEIMDFDKAFDSSSSDFNSMDDNLDNMSPTSEQRKTSKPIMEKRRRARINASLSELKSLLLEVMKKEGTRHHKMEKADILEMTVKHLRQLQRTQFTAALTGDPSVVDKYKSGFTECANEVSRYLASIETNDVELRARLINHLANTIQRPSNNTSPVPVTLTSPTSTPITAHVRPLQIQTTPLVGQDQGSPINLSTKVASVLPEINNNTIPQTQGFMTAVTSPPQTTTAKVLGGVQLIPSRLPSGEVAFVIPGNVLTASAMSNYVIPLYAGPSVAQTSPPAGSTSPTVISPPAQAVPVSLPQTPIMILPTNVSRTTSPVTSESTSPDSSTNSNTTNIISLPTREQATTSPTLKDSTNRNIQQQPHKAFNIEPEVQDIKLPVEQAACTDENMWRPW